MPAASHACEPFVDEELTFTTAEMQPADVSFLDQEDYYDAHEDEDEA